MCDPYVYLGLTVVLVGSEVDGLRSQKVACRKEGSIHAKMYIRNRFFLRSFVERQGFRNPKEAQEAGSYIGS